ncbi:Two-component hybrid sensor and regulator [Bacillus badius]|uniref:histidine kinase n=3 Tax=Bacillus badius TaxID=1455 RepID=A0ABR5ATA2_BACBA|nr:Two-component hybrid sensor and regulator [Bacillus badius]
MNHFPRSTGFFFITVHVHNNGLMKKGKTMKLRTKLYIGFAFLFGLFVLSYFILTAMMNQLGQNTGVAMKNHQMMNLANTIQDELNIFSRESRGLLSNPPEELIGELEKNREEALVNVRAAIASLEKLDNRRQSQQLIQELKRLGKEYSALEKKTDALAKMGEDKKLIKMFWYDSREVREEMTEISKKLQAIQKKTIDQELKKSAKTSKQTIHIIFAYIVAVFLIVLIVMTWIVRSITGSLKKVTSVMTEVAFDHPDYLPRIEVTTKDEMGEIALAFNAMAQSLEEHALQEKQLKHEAEERSWLSTKIAEVVHMYPGMDHLDALAQWFINKVAAISGADYGVFYIREQEGTEERLRKVAGYADAQSSSEGQSFKLGEGIVGQCAMENRIVSMDPVPADYIKIQSGLGSAPPAHVLVMPAEFQGKVLAVIELASFQPFDRLQQLFLQEVVGNAGMNINRTLNHMKVEKLLEEFQAVNEELQTQSEELQLQQEELRTVNEQLEEQYEQSEQKTRELEQIRQALEEKAQQLTISSQYKSEFLANMSHELRTPLNSLLILAQMLADNAENNLTPEQIEYATTIFSSGKDLLNMINDILDIAKVEAGKMEVVFEDVKVSDIKDFAEAQFLPVARKKKVQFNIEVAAGLPEVIRTDKQRLQQILKNLLSNAFKFTEHGAVSLLIQKADDKHSGMEVSFAVKDTGIGISEENLTFIFEAFRQADGTISRKYGGTGLGLSISKEMAHLLGGFIEVESIVDDGSTFILYLPDCHKAEQAEYLSYPLEAAAGKSEGTNEAPADDLAFPSLSYEEKEEMMERSTMLKSKKIFIVDDDMRNIFALTAALENYGAEVKFAENGREGIELLKENPKADLVFMDIMIPEMNGLEAIQAIRQMAGFENLPIIALTAKAMKEDRKQCIDAGASDYISKPINLEQLFSIIQVWLYK